MQLCEHRQTFSYSKVNICYEPKHKRALQNTSLIKTIKPAATVKELKIFIRLNMGPAILR